MLKLNFNDGTTLEFNLLKQEDLIQWKEWSSVQDFQDRITGIGVLANKRLHQMPLPRGFQKVRFSAELLYVTKKGKRILKGEILKVHVDNVEMKLTVYTCKNPPAPVLSKLEINKIGKQRGPVMSN